MGFKNEFYRRSNEIDEKGHIMVDISEFAKENGIEYKVILEPDIFRGAFLLTTEVDGGSLSVAIQRDLLNIGEHTKTAWEEDGAHTYTFKTTEKSARETLVLGLNQLKNAIERKINNGRKRTKQD